jgi:hypothetical protein
MQSLKTRNATLVSTRAQRNIRGQKQRLFRIALLTTICLLVQGTLIVLISSTLEEWSYSSEVLLHCTLYETDFNRNWDAHGYTEGDVVCSLEKTMSNVGSVAELTGVFFGADEAFLGERSDLVCTSDCAFTNKSPIPGFSFTTPGLVCDSIASDNTKKKLGCSCACDEIVQIEQPSVLAMTLSHLAQSLVVTIVGLNMGLRCDPENHHRSPPPPHTFSPVPSILTLSCMLIFLHQP